MEILAILFDAVARDTINAPGTGVEWKTPKGGYPQGQLLFGGYLRDLFLQDRLGQWTHLRLLRTGRSIHPPAPVRAS
jgi:hypothetical protein